MAEIKVGTTCLVKESSVDSLIFWKQMSGRFPYLLCPCSIKSTTKLEVIELLGTSAVLVRLKDAQSKLSVFKKKDLKVCSS